MRKHLRNVGCALRFLLNITLFAILLGGQLPALNPDTPVDQYIIEHWEENNKGLPSNLIITMVQTPDGYLCFGTSKGLVRFDGIKFSTFQFIQGKETEQLKNSNLNIDMLLVDREKNLWIGSNAGLTRFRIQTGEFKTFTHNDGLPRDHIRFLKEDRKGNLWISFFNGYLGCYTNNKFTLFNESHGLAKYKINTIIENRKGSLLLGTRENGLLEFQEGKFLQVAAGSLDNSYIITMHEDREGERWIGTNKGLLRTSVSGKNNKYTTKDGLADDYITDIIEDSDGNLWVGTVKGLTRIQKKTADTLVFDCMFKPFTIMCLLEDNEKNLWVGTYDSGIQCLKNSNFRTYDALNDQPGEILLCQFEDRNGDTWVGSLAGKLFQCRGNESISTVTFPGISGVGITCISDDADGNLWLGSNGNGVWQWYKKTLLQLTTREGLADNMVTSITRDSRDNLWFCTLNGVSCYKNGRLETFRQADGLLGKNAHNVYEDHKKDIWIATDKGITVLKNGTITRENINYYLKDVSISCIYQDNTAANEGNEVYWIATYGAGLKRLKNGIITSFTTSEGLATNFIYQFFEDTRENFWLMSDSGILRIDKKSLNRFLDSGNITGVNSIDIVDYTSFGTANGMKSSEFNYEFSRSSAIKTRNGEFRFITKKGITVLNPEKIKSDNMLPQVMIEAVLFNDQPVDFTQWIKNKKPVSFKGVTDLKFQFTAPAFLAPGRIKFKYRLGTVDKEWIFLPPGKERIAHYKNIPPGSYTFNVMAGNSTGKWSQTGSTLTFILVPFFYETLIFKIVAILFVMVFSSAGFYFYRKRLARKKIKYKTSQLNPKFADECVKKLKHLMEIEKIYSQTDLSLNALAEKMSIGHHVLSQVLNEKLNRNFSDYVNSYRIEEAKKIMVGPQGDEQKITSIAYDVGFNTTVAFYNAFKKYTGMTPSEYKKSGNKT